MTFRAHGTCITLEREGNVQQLEGNAWRALDELLAPLQLKDLPACEVPLGACIGSWGYELKHQLEPKLRRTATCDLNMPDCQAGFYDSLLVVDHFSDQTLVVSTGLQVDGNLNEARRAEMFAFWKGVLASLVPMPSTSVPQGEAVSNMSAAEFQDRVRSAQRYIQHGEIYQVNLSHRLSADLRIDPVQFFTNLCAHSPAPFASYLDGGDFQIVSSSPELFLEMRGRSIRTRPIKGTRPRSPDPAADEQLGHELQASSKENAELVMITDLLRNDLGRCCDFGSVEVPELVRLERYAHVQHLVSTVHGRLRAGLSHLQALATCFPGGSITGAPKFRAMDIIEELEPVVRGPYTGALGYFGFNQQSQLSILIRTAACVRGRAYFHAGAGIVADSDPRAEYDETLAKAKGFMNALNLRLQNTK